MYYNKIAQPYLSEIRLGLLYASASEIKLYHQLNSNTKMTDDFFYVFTFFFCLSDQVPGLRTMATNFVFSGMISRTPLSAK